MSLTYHTKLIDCSKKYGSYYLSGGNGTLHTKLLIMKGYFMSLSHTNIVPVHTVLSTQMEPDFINRKCKFLIRNTAMYCSQKSVTKIQSSLIIAFFNSLNLSTFDTAVDITSSHCPYCCCQNPCLMSYLCQGFESCLSICLQ
jgi:hypothetical protein